MARRNEPPPADLDAARIDDVLRDRIAHRAYEISQTDEAGTDEENWLRAERELDPSTSSRK